MSNVVVTGGSRGLGLGICRTLIAAGFQVIAVARRDTAELADLREDVERSYCGRLHFRAFDLHQTSAIAQFVKGLRAEFGPITGLVNNAGLGSAGILATMREDTLEELVRLNVLAPMILTKSIVRSMLSERQGCIVNISSIVSTTGYSGLAGYSATKAAMNGFTRSLARELGPLGITVNAVAPGFIETEMTHSLTPGDREKVQRRSALQRLPQVTDVAAMVGFLFSEQARNITGTVMTVDAGSTA